MAALSLCNATIKQLRGVAGLTLFEVCRDPTCGHTVNRHANPVQAAEEPAQVRAVIEIVEFDFLKILSQYPVSSINEALSQPLPFKIPIGSAALVAASRGVFYLGSWPEAFGMVGWMEESSLQGASEISVACRDNIWIGVIRLALQVVNVHRDQRNCDSNDVVLRTDSMLYYKDALFLNAVAKYSDSDHQIASEELTSKFSPEAFQLFPMGSHSIIGVTSSANRIRLYKLSYNEEHKYECELLRMYSINNLNGRISFIIDVIKLLRWVVTITGPASTDIHLVPGVRFETTNEHHVRWVRDGLLKEFNRRKDLSVMSHIKHVYGQKLPHVEWGVVIGQNKLLITRVGMRIQRAIMDELITKELAIEHIRLALEELHAIGLAHCDVFIENVFYDKVTCCAFLADLEYLTPLNEPAPNTKIFGCEPTTAVPYHTLHGILFTVFQRNEDSKSFNRPDSTLRSTYLRSLSLSPETLLVLWLIESVTGFVLNSFQVTCLKT
eukprot:gene6272-12703_t